MTVTNISGISATPVSLAGLANLSSNNVFTGTNNFTNNTTLIGGAVVQLGFGASGTWINMPTNGLSGIGDGGPGINPWIAYVSQNSAYFSNALIGDKCYRTQTNSRILMGVDDGTGFSVSSFIISSAAITVNSIMNATVGVATSATSATAVIIGVSPFTFTNTVGRNIQMFIQGGTVSSIGYKPNGGTSLPLAGLTDNVLTMRPNDQVVVTYAVAPTTMSYVGL